MFKLENVVPWGRSFEEYVKMFNLTSHDLEVSILDCAGGPSSFNARLTNSGGKVISCDPIYQFTVEEIQQRIEATYPVIIQGLEENFNRFVWGDIKSPQHLGEVRMGAMNQFLNDFEMGMKAKRYQTQVLPQLSFDSGKFDLALCSHFLFTYSEQFSFDFHLAAVLEMCRVGKEVRVFPLLENFTGEPSPYLEPIKKELVRRGYQVVIKQVSYEFQKNGAPRSGSLRERLLQVFPSAS